MVENFISSSWQNNKMNCPKCDHENSTEDSVIQVAESPCGCHIVAL